MNFKRAIALILSLVMTAGMVACGGNSAPASSAPASSAPASSEAAADKPSLVITFNDSQPETSLIGTSIKNFGKYLAEESDGRIKLEYYPAAQLGNGTTSMQQMQVGALDMYRCDASALYDFGVDSMKVPGLPFIFESREHAIEIVNGDLGHQWLQDITDANVGFVGIGWLIDTPRCFFTAKTPVTKLADAKGLKIRSLEASMYLDYKSGLGLNPVPLAFSEVYTSLSTGVIDVAANTLDSFVNNKFEEVCKYFILNEGMIPLYPVVFSAENWKKISEEDQKIIIDCWNRASADYDAAAGDLFETQKKDMEAAGVTFCELEDKEAWIEATEPVIAKYSTGYEDVVAEIRSWYTK